MQVPIRLLLAAALVAVSAPGYAAAAPAPPALAGTNVVTGSRTAGMRVRLTRTTTIRLRTDRQRITGDGRVVGVVLNKTTHADFKRPVYAHLRFGFCSTPGCRAKSTIQGATGFNAVGEPFEERLVLTKGDYQLYVVADGKPVTVTLTLPGLKGTRRFRPTVPNRFGPHSPTVRTPATPSTTAVYAAGDVHEFRGDGGGLSIQLISLRAGVWAAGRVEDCLYVERPAVPALAFQPGCPGGAGGSPSIVDGVVSAYPIERQYVMNSYLRMIPGVLGHGASFVAAAEVREVHIPSLQLEFGTIR